ncbi:Tannase and feruloyl esterase [compost metagenome]
MIPGYAHGSGTFNSSWDSLPVLEKWVEGGTPPPVDTVKIMDANTATKGRTRPLCDFPKWPQYKGAGDADVAVNYECVAS